jgi:acyl-CoA dehydrogenase
MPETLGGYELPEELQMLRDVVRRFIEREVLPLEAEMDFEQTHLPPEKLKPLQDKARSAGLWQMGAPAEYGGQGLNAFGMAIVAEESHKHRNGNYNAALGAFGRQPSPPLYGGTKDQIERFVIPTIEGTKSGFFAITEPSGGSDPARSIITRAVKKGDHWVLNGRKVFISGADRADYGVVVARTGEGRSGLTSFIVEKGMPGFSWKVLPVIRPDYPTEVLLEDVEVPEENVLRGQGEGFAVAQSFLVRGRIPYAAGCIGVGQKALDMSVAYAKDRVTFGEPLANRQAVQWMLVDSEIELRSARWLVWEAAWKVDRGEPARMEASIAKLTATETAGRVVDRAIQIHGGMGVTKEMPFERWYRELRIKRIGEGPSEVHKMVIARDMLRPERRLS